MSGAPEAVEYLPGRGLPDALLYPMFLVPVLAGGGLAVALGQAWAGGLVGVGLGCGVAYLWGSTRTWLRVDREAGALVLEHRLGERRWRRALAPLDALEGAAFHQHHEEVELEVRHAGGTLTLGPFQDPQEAQRLVAGLGLPS